MRGTVSGVMRSFRGNLLDVYERQDAQFEAAWRCRGRCQSLLWLVRQVHLNINRKMEIFVGCTRQTEASLILSLPNFLTLCPTVGTSPAMYRRPRSPTLDWPQCPPPPPPQRRSSTSPEQVSLTAFKIEFVASVPRLRWVSRENLYTKPNSISASDV